MVCAPLPTPHSGQVRTRYLEAKATYRGQNSHIEHSFLGLIGSWKLQVFAPVISCVYSVYSVLSYVYSVYSVLSSFLLS